MPHHLRGLVRNDRFFDSLTMPRLKRRGILSLRLSTFVSMLTNWNSGYRLNAAARQLGICRGKERPRTTRSFRTSAHAGVGISIEFQASHRHTDCFFCIFPELIREIVLLSRRLPRQCDHWLAMTWNSIARQISICRFAELILICD